jgi:hypothetical protein
MNSGGYYNKPAADWARRNIKTPVEIRMRFNSTAGKVFTYSLIFCVPAAFFALGLYGILTGVKDRNAVYAAFFFGLLLIIPFGFIALLGVYVRRGLAKSLDSEGVNAPLGRKFYWGKLYYVDHVTKHFRAGGASRRVSDNQLELVFEDGKVTIPPLIYDRGMIWDLINALPSHVRDDGVPRVREQQIMTEEDLRSFLNLPRETGKQDR